MFPELKKWCDAKISILFGSGGSVGRAVASNTRDLRFESQHRQNFIYQLYIIIEKTKIKKRGWEWPIFKKNIWGSIFFINSNGKTQISVAFGKKSPQPKIESDRIRFSFGIFKFRFFIGRQNLGANFFCELMKSFLLFKKTFCQNFLFKVGQLSKVIPEKSEKVILNRKKVWKKF